MADFGATLPIGMTFDLTAEQYARGWALPQFHFHVMTAYAILRAQGIELGKFDYTAHMSAFLRPLTTGLTLGHGIADFYLRGKLRFAGLIHSVTL